MTLIRDWVVDSPANGFVFPAFIDRGSDVNSIMYYTKNAKDTHPELMENALGCYSKQTAIIQKETFQTIIKDTVSADEQKAEKIFMEIQDNLNTMIDDYNAIYDDTDCDPITLTKKDIQNLLIESGVPEEDTSKIEKSYLESFGDDLPLAENLIDSKVLKANEQRKKEEHLEKQVEILQNRLEQVNLESSENNQSLASENDATDNVSLDSALEDNLDEDQSIYSEDNNHDSHYDVILQVNPEKIPKIKAQIIDGQKCIVIPIDENEQTTVNGLDDLI